MVAPIYELALPHGVGRRLEESALGLIAGIRVLRAVRGT